MAWSTSDLGHKRTSERRPINVRFTPESGHRWAQLPCPLCAKSRHSAMQQMQPQQPEVEIACGILDERWSLSLSVKKRVDIRCVFCSRDCDLCTQLHDQCMPTHARSSTPDLFSSAPAREAYSRSTESAESSPAIMHAPPRAIPSRHVLPADLPNAVRHLDDHELDQLLSAGIAEQKRRSKKLALKISQPRRVRVVAAAPLTQGKLNAVRAAFKAGVTPSRIARQFGISHSDVRKALASDISKR